MNNALLLTLVDHSFPLRAGMSRWWLAVVAAGSRFPRVSGDEPTIVMTLVTNLPLSLREWGRTLHSGTMVGQHPVFPTLAGMSRVSKGIGD